MTEPLASEASTPSVGAYGFSGAARPSLKVSGKYFGQVDERDGSRGRRER